MRLEDQVVSLELAKKLKELGIDQEAGCGFYWHKDKLVFAHSECGNHAIGDWNNYIAAFTVAELGEMLPRFYESHRTNGITPEIEWTCQYKEDGKVTHQVSNTEADARAKMLVYLLENGLMKPEKEAA